MITQAQGDALHTTILGPLSMCMYVCVCCVLVDSRSPLTIWHRQIIPTFSVHPVFNTLVQMFNFKWLMRVRSFIQLFCCIFSFQMGKYYSSCIMFLEWLNGCHQWQHWKWTTNAKYSIIYKSTTSLYLFLLHLHAHTCGFSMLISSSNKIALIPWLWFYSFMQHVENPLDLTMELHPLSFFSHKLLL